MSTENSAEIDETNENLFSLLVGWLQKCGHLYLRAARLAGT